MLECICRLVLHKRYSILNRVSRLDLLSEVSFNGSSSMLCRQIVCSGVPGDYFFHLSGAMTSSNDNYFLDADPMGTIRIAYFLETFSKLSAGISSGRHMLL